MRRGTAKGLSCSTAMAGEMPHELAVSLSREAFMAGGEPVLVEVRLQFVGRLPSSDPVIKFESDLGKISGVVRATDDSYSLVWKPPNEFEGKQTATITAYVADEALIAASAKLSLQPSKAVRLDVLQETGPGNDIRLRVQLHDAFGNGFHATELSAIADAGSVGPFRSKGNGGLRSGVSAAFSLGRQRSRCRSAWRVRPGVRAVRPARIGSEPVPCHGSRGLSGKREPHRGAEGVGGRWISTATFWGSAHRRARNGACTTAAMNSRAQTR